jgi:CheY-like chemotaxis protein/Tfp pilus assembly protein PilZ
MAREPRFVLACEVEFDWQGEIIQGVSQDVSKKGIFVRSDRVVPVGEVVELVVRLSEGHAVRLPARVAHVLGDRAATALGRPPGLGFAFAEDSWDGGGPLGRLHDHLEELAPALSLPPETGPRATRVLVADGSTPLLERVSTALGNAGFVVGTVTNGAEAFSQCLHAPPDLVLCAADMPVVDGWRLLAMLSTRQDLTRIPVVLMSEHADDLTRLRAYRLGVVDFIPKPFTVAELCIRMRRLSRSQIAGSERVVLRGSLAELGPPTLLSLLEFERKSGVLTLSNDERIYWIVVDAGRVLKVESESDSGKSFDLLMRVLDWDAGNFEFAACQVYDEDEIGRGTTQLLLEHARVRDEQRRSSRPPVGAN